MVDRKPFLLRLDPATMSALRAWAGDDLRSLNGQIEYVLRRALRETGRLPTPSRAHASRQQGGREQREGGEEPASDPSQSGAIGAGSEGTRPRRDPAPVKG